MYITCEEGWDDMYEMDEYNWTINFGAETLEGRIEGTEGVGWSTPRGGDGMFSKIETECYLLGFEADPAFVQRREVFLNRFPHLRS